MLQALRHGHPLVNGHSSFFPKESIKILSYLNAFPVKPAFDLLRENGVRYVVMDRKWMRRKRLEEDDDRLPDLVFEGDGQRIHILPPAETD